MNGPWILAATILGSSMAFIDGTVVNVALPALQSALHATLADVQWVVESYALFLAMHGSAFGAVARFISCGQVLLHNPDGRSCKTVPRCCWHRCSIGCNTYCLSKLHNCMQGEHIS
jgi:MFS family permease